MFEFQGMILYSVHIATSFTDTLFIFYSFRFLFIQSNKIVILYTLVLGKLQSIEYLFIYFFMFLVVVDDICFAIMEEGFTLIWGDSSR